jgi:hypothetical protein
MIVYPGCVTGLRVDAAVLLGQDAELIRYPSDEIWLRAAGHGDIQVSIGAPYDAFARDMARLFAAGAPLEEIAQVAAGHGVRLG